MVVLAVDAHSAPPASETPWLLETLGRPVVEFVAYGVPGPQGSKSFKGMRTSKKSGKKVAILAESSKKVTPWRNRVAAAARIAVGKAAPLDGPLVVDMVFTMPRPKAFPSGDDRREHGQHTRYPDVSKLIRSTEDAITGVVWADDARVIGYRRSDKLYVGAMDPDALTKPGVVVRVWRAPQSVIAARQGVIA